MENLFTSLFEMSLCDSILKMQRKIEILQEELIEVEEKYEKKLQNLEREKREKVTKQCHNISEYDIKKLNYFMIAGLG